MNEDALMDKRIIVSIASLAVLGTPLAARAASEGGGEGGLPLLGTSLAQVIFTLLLFGALLFVLGKFVWPHILKSLQDREQKIRSDLEEAEQANKQAQETLAQYKQQLSEAQKESQRIIEQSRQESQELAKQWKQQTQQELQQMRQRAEQEIQAAKEQAVSELYEQSATLATDVAGRILQREISASDQQQLIEQSLRELEQSRQ
jgi:F-type H+-transporting ATPase subunit b